MAVAYLLFIIMGECFYFMALAKIDAHSLPLLFCRHGARGYIASIGSAEVALELMEKELERVY